MNCQMRHRGTIYKSVYKCERYNNNCEHKIFGVTTDFVSLAEFDLRTINSYTSVYN